MEDSQTRGDPVAQSIHGLKLYSNHITMMLKYVNVLLCYVGFMCGVPYREPGFSDEEEEEIASRKCKKKTVSLCISVR